MRGYRRTGIVIGLTGARMWLFLRSADLASVWSHIRRAKLDLISAAFGAIAVSYLVRVGRWQRLLAPIAQVGFAPAVRATVIGFATTAVLPGRLGEVLRPYLLARRERLSASAVLATVVLERLLDVITVVLLFGVFLLFFSGDLQQTDPQVLTYLTVGGLVAAVGAALVLHALSFGPVTLLGIVWMARDGSTLRSAVHLVSSGGMADVSDMEPVEVSDPEACGPTPSRGWSVRASVPLRRFVEQRPWAAPDWPGATRDQIGEW